MTYIEHITLTTGHTRRSERAEVDAAVIATLQPLLAEAMHGHVVVPGLGTDSLRLTLTGSQEGRCSVWTVWAWLPEGRAPVVTLGVAFHSRCGAQLWRLLHEDAEWTGIELQTDPERCPPEPWIGARLDIGSAVMPAEVMLRLGDFERCVAWALAEERRES